MHVCIRATTSSPQFALGAVLKYGWVKPSFWPISLFGTRQRSPPRSRRPPSSWTCSRLACACVKKKVENILNTCYNTQMSRECSNDSIPSLQQSWKWTSWPPGTYFSPLQTGGFSTSMLVSGSVVCLYLKAAPRHQPLRAHPTTMSCGPSVWFLYTEWCSLVRGCTSVLLWSHLATLGLCRRRFSPGFHRRCWRSA